EQRREGHRPEAHTALLEKPAAGNEVRVLAAIELGLAVHKLVNDKCSITNDRTMTNVQFISPFGICGLGFLWALVIWNSSFPADRHSNFFRHSDFVIRHSQTVIPS